MNEEEMVTKMYWIGRQFGTDLGAFLSEMDDPLGIFSRHWDKVMQGLQDGAIESFGDDRNKH